MNNSLFARKDQRKMQLCVGIQINATSVFKNELVFPTPRHDKGLILFRGNRSRLTGFDGQGVVFVIQSDVRILLWREVPFIFQIYRFSGCKNQKCPG